MRWFLAGIGLIVVIVVFSLAAIDQKNVVWVDGQAECPHCRNAVRLYSNVCSACGRAFDWQVREEPCEACFSVLDADYLKRLFIGHEREFEDLLRGGNVPDEAIPDLLLYARTFRSGSCGFCGGTGRWLAPGIWVGAAGNGGGGGERTEFLFERLEGRCPVCFGTGRCILCDGDHRTEYGREAAARDLSELKQLFSEVEPSRDPVSAESLRAALQAFVGTHAGRAEMWWAPSLFPDWAHHHEWASHRQEIFEGLLEKLR